MRVLIAWQHGHNLGHLARLLAVADALRLSNADVVWAIAATQRKSAAAVVAAGYKVMPAPPGMAHAPSTPLVSYVDILNAQGFAEVDLLSSQIRDWIALFKSEAVDHVLLDNAPGAQLAAYLIGLPTTQISNGFDAPPSGCPPFGLGMRGPWVDARNQQRHDGLSARIADVATRLVGRSGATLAAMLGHPRRWFDCVVETDPYGRLRSRRRGDAYIGPQGRPPEAAEVTWPAATRSQSPRVLVYLRGSAAPAAALAALANHGAQVICAWPDAKAVDVELAARRDQIVVAGPIYLDLALQEADWVVNYGSSGFVCQSLLAGKPQLMMPSDTEKYLVAGTVQSIDAGVVIRVPPAHSAGNFQRTVEEALTRLPQARASAQQVAQRYASISWRDQVMAAVRSLVERHEPLAGSTRSHPNSVDAGQST